MKNKLFITIFVVLTTISLNAQVVVIANKLVPTVSMTSESLESIYSLEQDIWDDGSKVILFDIRKEIPSKTTFYNFLGKSSRVMKKNWLKAKLSGEGIPPTAVVSEEELLEKVSSTPGAIGYISKSKVTDSVKILATIN